MRGARREGGTGVTAINSSPIGPPLILLRSYAFFPFLLSLSLLLFILDSSSSSFSCQPTRYTRAISVNQIRSSKTTTKRSIRRGQDEGGCCDRSGTRNNGMHRGDPLRAVSSSSTSSRHFLFLLFPNDYWK